MEKDWEKAFTMDYNVNIGSPHYLDNKYGSAWPYDHPVESVGDVKDIHMKLATHVYFWGKDRDDALNHMAVLRMIFPEAKIFFFFPDPASRIGCAYYARSPK